LKRYAGTAVLLGLLAGLAAALFLWWTPASDFLIVPDKAKSLAAKVDVEGGRPNAKGDVYYVDVFVRRIRRLEQLLPFTRPDGATIVPERAIAPAGTTDEERNKQNAADMRRSEQIASVVALKALGYAVTATPRGILVTAVTPDVPAAKVLDPQDVIVAVDGEQVRTPVELREEIGKLQPGDSVTLTIHRDGKTKDVTVKTIANPNDSAQAIIGILVDQDAKIRLPLDVNIDLGRVGGPSAGLPFALEIARQLRRGITHGCRIAATGELALDGSVLPIGGIEQKTIGVRRAGVDYFFVPVGENATIAQRYADGLHVIPVESFQQALRKLATDVKKC
jgi:PDZ domain-containing protein